jgi:hypothetical protein
MNRYFRLVFGIAGCMPESCDTALLTDFDSLKISRPDFSQSFMFNKYLVHIDFIHGNKHIHVTACLQAINCDMTLSCTWKRGRVRMVPRYLQNFCMGRSNVAKIVGGKCSYLVYLSYRLTKINKKQPYQYNEIKRSKYRSTNSTNSSNVMQKCRIFSWYGFDDRN